MSLNTRIVIRIVIVLAFFAAVVFSIYFFIVGPRLRYLSAVSLTSDISIAAAHYGEDYGRLPELNAAISILRGENPESLNYLPEIPDSMVEGNSVIDPWGHLLEFSVAIRPEGAVLAVLSAGSDGMFETEDDINETHFRAVMNSTGGTRESDSPAPKKPILKPSTH